MRNLKKILAMALALVMSFSLMSVSSAAFQDDADVTDTFAESVEVLNGLKVFEGYEDGSFKPQGSITRAEVAAIIYRVVTGDVDDKQVGIYADYNVFSDVKSTSWYAGYVNYCANAKYIKGYGDGKFGPNDPVTGYQALAMILRAIGYDKNNEFSGSSWQVETAKIANLRGITKNVTANLLGGAATREVVAEVLFRTIMVPQVTYTLALGYTEYQNKLENTGVKNPSLAWQNFKLEKLTGEITAVGRAANTTTLEGVQLGDETTVSKAVVKNTDTSWEFIGYKGYVYATPTTAVVNNTKTWNAVTGVNVIGESLKVSHDGTKWATISKNLLDTAVTYYYNGVQLTDGSAKIDDETITVADLQNMATQVGVKFDFIDNDFGGKAEVVAVTDYTVTYVSGAAGTTNTGVNAIKKDYTYFANGEVVKNANLVCDTAVAVNDLVTYVEYADDFYVVVAPFQTGNFTAIINASTAAQREYVIGGNNYKLSADHLNATAWLVRANFNRDTIVFVDPYGYVLTAERNTVQDYLYVIRANHTNVVDDYSRATVAFADGTIETVNVVDRNGRPFQPGAEMYTYTIDENGLYRLTLVCADVADSHVEPVDYDNFRTNNNVEITDGVDTYYLTNASVIVDLRDECDNIRTGAVVYNGYAELPSLRNAEFHVVPVAAGSQFVRLAFLTEGTNTASDSFILYDAVHEKDEVQVAANGAVSRLYHYDAIVNGEISLVKDGGGVTLTAGQKAIVDNHGVGIYTVFGVWGAMTYTSFMEEWVDITWNSGVLLVHNVDGTVNRANAYSNPVFITMDIANGAAYSYEMNFGTDFDNVKAVLVYDNAVNANVVEIYVIAGELAETREVDDEGNKTGVTVFNDGIDTYFVEKGFVTTVMSSTDAAKFAGAKNAFDGAVKAVNYANQILAANGYTFAAFEPDTTGFEGKVAEVMKKEASYANRIEFALALLEAAKADMEWALGVLETLVDTLPAGQNELVKEMVFDANEINDAVTENVAEIKNSSAYALIEAKNNAGNEVIASLDTAIKAQENANKIYGVKGDVYLTDSDAAYEVANDVTLFTYEKAETTLFDVVQGWFAQINAVAKEADLAKTVAALKTKVAEVAKLYVEALAK
ncbi:MAG: S-layer homology domain-containing protein [Oscillospiraceae bacterium]|nr:S-layer homology domain-containing protein [Oscillospiraceae bacterium]